MKNIRSTDTQHPVVLCLYTFRTQNTQTKTHNAQNKLRNTNTESYTEHNAKG